MERLRDRTQHVVRPGRRLRSQGHRSIDRNAGYVVPSIAELILLRPTDGVELQLDDHESTVDGLYPLGATNQPIGLVWGWQSLVGGGPIATPHAETVGYQYSKVIILMSEGLNTLDRWYGNGSTTNTSVDKRMVDTDGTGTCANIKAAGITIYTVQVNTGGDPQSALLKSCASTSDKFWMVTTANGLGAEFTLSSLQIAS
jgi:hypothetical protein